MISRISIILLMTVISVLNAQDGNCNLEVNKKADKVYRKGVEKLRISPSEGIALIKESVEIDPDFLEAYFLLGSYYFDQVTSSRNKTIQASTKKSMTEKSIKYYLEVQRICPSFSGHGAAFDLGELYKSQEDKPNSAKYFRYYVENEKEQPQAKHERAKLVSDLFFMRDFLKSNPVDYNPEEVDGINTSKDEFLPMLSPDNEQIFFTRRVEDKMTDAPFFEQLMVSRLIGPNEFNGGMPLGGPFDDMKLSINGVLVVGKGGVTITPDNNHLFVTLVMDIDGKPYNNVDIYYSDKTNGHWSDLKPIKGEVNDEDGYPTWEGQPTISSDGKTIIFSSVREASVKRWDKAICNMPEDSIPTMDLFEINKLANGDWSKPKSLGKVINTAGNEKTPFLHTDSKTLYFSSNGRPGMGSYDIYYTRQDDFGNWTEPKNLGYPINTEGAEVSFIVGLDGKLGYLSSGVEQADDGKALQIIGFPIPVEARPKKVVMVKGQLKDSKGNPVKQGTIEIKNTKTGEMTEAYVNGDNGEYVAVMTVESETEKLEIEGKEVEVPKKESEPIDYILTAKKEGAAFSSTVVTADPDEIDGAKKLRGKDITVDPVVVGKPYRINDITFATNSSDLNKRTVMILDEFIDFLESNKAFKVSIQGHTDNVGDDKENMSLSEARAKAVHDYILLNDIDSSRLSFKGYGETKPIASNNTESGRANNRRTEFVLSK